MKPSHRSIRKSRQATGPLRLLERAHAGDWHRTSADFPRDGMRVREQAKQILGILVRHAGGAGGPLTYGDLTRETGIAHCALRAPMNRLITALERCAADSRKRIPPLQVLVVNGRTGVPGSGAWVHVGRPYVGDSGSETFTDGEKRNVVARIHKDIAHYRDWQTVGQVVMKLL